MKSYVTEGITEGNSFISIAQNFTFYPILHRVFYHCNTCGVNMSRLITGTSKTKKLEISTKNTHHTKRGN